MAQRKQIVLIDVIDGTEIKDGGAQPITFTWSGLDYCSFALHVRDS